MFICMHDREISIKSISLLLITFFITGCSTAHKEASRLCANDEGDFYKCEDTPFITTKQNQENSARFNPNTNFQTINEYTEQLAYALYQKVSNKNIKKTIAVPPFICFSSTGLGSRRLNARMAEAFVIDMQSMGLPVAYFSLSNNSYEEQTNFLNYIESIPENQHFGYVVKGTIKETKGGAMIYTSIIDIATQKDIAATSKFLPKYLLNTFK